MFGQKGFAQHSHHSVFITLQSKTFLMTHSIGVSIKGSRFREHISDSYKEALAVSWQK